MADGVIDSLRELVQLPGLAVSTVTGFGRFRARAEEPERADDADMTEIEIVVTDELAEAVVAAIVRAARTGREGDGKIFVSDVCDVLKIRTEGCHVHNRTIGRRRIGWTSDSQGACELD